MTSRRSWAASAGALAVVAASASSAIAAVAQTDGGAPCVAAALLARDRPTLTAVCGTMSIDLPRSWSITSGRATGALFAAQDSADGSAPQLYFTIDVRRRYASVAALEAAARRAPFVVAGRRLERQVRRVRLPAGTALEVHALSSQYSFRAYWFLHDGRSYQFAFTGLRRRDTVDRALTKKLVATVRFGRANGVAVSRIAYLPLWTVRVHDAGGTLAAVATVDALEFRAGTWTAGARVENHARRALKFDVALVRYRDASHPRRFAKKDVSDRTRYTTLATRTARPPTVAPDDFWTGTVSGRDKSRTGPVVRLVISFQVGLRPPAELTLWTSDTLRVPVARHVS